MSSLAAPRLPGTVCTFYSYKGGVGRSMALVNIGTLLALRGKKVLLVDWDLEAPGLEVYFRDTATLSHDPAVRPGVIDLLHAHASPSESLRWADCVLTATFLGGSIDLISSGMRNSDYRRRVQQLDWKALYEESHIGDYVNALREEWRATYDFVLVDSRTGITDIADICTVLLPDILVLMFVTNKQNVDGIKYAMERALAARKNLPDDRAKLLALPLPARAEAYSEYDKTLAWTKIFAEEFGLLFRDWLPKGVTPEEALNKVFIPYVTIWSFGERIPVLEGRHEIERPTSIGSAYLRVATLLETKLDWLALSSHESAGSLQISLRQAESSLKDANTAIAKSASLASRAKNIGLGAIVLALVASLGSVAYLFKEKAQRVEEQSKLLALQSKAAAEQAERALAAATAAANRAIEEQRVAAASRAYAVAIGEGHDAFAKQDYRKALDSFNTAARIVPVGEADVFRARAKTWERIAAQSKGPAADGANENKISDLERWVQIAPTASRRVFVADAAYGLKQFARAAVQLEAASLLAPTEGLGSVVQDRALGMTEGLLRTGEISAAKAASWTAAFKRSPNLGKPTDRTLKLVQDR